MPSRVGTSGEGTPQAVRRAGLYGKMSTVLRRGWGGSYPFPETPFQIKEGLPPGIRGGGTPLFLAGSLSPPPLHPSRFNTSLPKSSGGGGSATPLPAGFGERGEVRPPLFQESPPFVWKGLRQLVPTFFTTHACRRGLGGGTRYSGTGR